MRRLVLTVMAVFFLWQAAFNLAVADPGTATIEQLLQSFSTVPGVFGRKDPFVEAAPPFSVPQPEPQSLSQDPLQRYDVNSYTITAVLLGDVYNRALVKTPDGKMLIVRERDHLGNHSGLIRKISQEGVTVVEVIGTKKSAHKNTVVLPVLTQKDGGDQK